jgi:hypothetical protein
MNEHNENTESEYRFSNWMATADNIALSWLAYRELLSRKSIGINVGDQVMSLYNRGWSRRWLGADMPMKDEQIIERMSANPYDFCVAYDAGVDILEVQSYHCLMPWELPSLIEDFQPNSSAITSAMQLFESGKLNAQKEAMAMEGTKNTKSDTVFSTMKLSPFVFSNPIKKIFNEYGIDGDRVYVRKSLGGFTFNDKSSHPVRLIRDVRSEGNRFVGKVIFRDDTGDVVVWDNVFLPRSKTRYAKKILAEYQTLESANEHSNLRNERKCPFCAELILVEAKVCKHCHSKIER